MFEKFLVYTSKCTAYASPHKKTTPLNIQLCNIKLWAHYADAGLILI